MKIDRSTGIGSNNGIKVVLKNVTVKSVKNEIKFWWILKNILFQSAESLSITVRMEYMFESFVYGFHVTNDFQYYINNVYNNVFTGQYWLNFCDSNLFDQRTLFVFWLWFLILNRPNGGFQFQDFLSTQLTFR